MLKLASAALPKVLALRFNSVCTCIQYLVNYAFIVLAVALVNAPTYSLTGQRAFHKTGFALIATYSSAIVGKVLYLDFRQVITEGFASRAYSQPHRSSELDRLLWILH